MKDKDIKAFAKKIAKWEQVLSVSTDARERAQAEREITQISLKIKSLDDMIAIDEAVQDILSKNS